MTGKELGQQPAAGIPVVYSDEVLRREGNGLVMQGAPGLTKRQAFAQAAMEGMLANDDAWPDDHDPVHVRLCRRAVEYADALLNELAKEQP